MTPFQMAIREKAFGLIKGVFFKHGACAASYTHLTLPTNREV